MHYTGTLKSDGSQFDSSRSRGRPFKFVIGIGQVQQYASTSYCISVLPKARLTVRIVNFCVYITMQVIKGWDEGVAKMSLGEKARLEITSDYGYGANGALAHVCVLYLFLVMLIPYISLSLSLSCYFRCG